MWTTKTSTWLRWPLIWLATAAAYVLLAKMSIALGSIAHYVGAFWLPAGLATSLPLSLGYRILPGIFLGEFFQDLSVPGPMWKHLALGMSNALDAAIVGYLAPRLMKGRDIFQSVSSFFGFFAAVALGGTQHALTGAVLLPWCSGMVTSETSGEMLRTWFVGDMGGSLIVAPILLSLSITNRRTWSKCRCLEFAALLLAVVVMTNVIFNDWLMVKRAPLSFLLLPLLLIGAFRLEPLASSILNAVMVGLAFWGTAQGRGPFVTETATESLVLVQLFSSVVIVTSLLVLIVERHSVQITESLRESEQRFRELFDHLPVAYQSLDVEGRWLDANQKMAELLGFDSPGEMLGGEFVDFWNVDEQKSFEALFGQFKETRNVSAELHLQRKDGQLVTALIAGRVQRDQQAKFLRTHCILIDVTERYAMEAALRMTENIPVGTYTLQISPDGVPKCVFLSKRWLEMLDLRREEVIAAPTRVLDKVHPDDMAACLRLKWEIFAKRQPFFWEGRLLSGGEYRWFTVESIPRELPNGGVAWEGVLTDINDRIIAQERLRTRELSTRKMLNNIPVAVASHTLNSEAETRFVNDRFVQTFGYTLEDVPTLQHWAQLAYPDPDYRKNAMALWLAAVDNARLGQGFVAPIECHVTCKDRTSRNVLISATVLDDVLLVSLVDITARKRAEEALQLSLAEIQRHAGQIDALCTMNALLLRCDSQEDAYRVVGEHAEKLFASNAGSLTIIDETSGAPLLAVTWGEFNNRCEAATCPVLTTGEVFDNTGLGTDHACLYRPTRASLCLPFTIDENLSGVLQLLDGPAVSLVQSHRDMGLLAATVGESAVMALSNLKLRADLREQAIRDQLTGLLNRRFLDETLPREIQRARRNGKSLTVAMLDVDHFKNFNDNYGHEAGDCVLQAVGGLLIGFIRGGDIACRYGGEEMTLILPETSPEEVWERMEALRLEVPQLSVEYDGGVLPPIYVSIGLAAMEPEDQAVDVLKRADVALYQAKATGRNRTVLAEQAKIRIQTRS